MESTPDIIDEVVINISSKQKGSITENRAIEMITLTSQGRLTCYSPNSDDDGIDIIVNPKASFKPLFIQVKSRFILQKSGRFIQNVGKQTFTSHENFYILFIYFNQTTLEVEKLWLIPSVDFEALAYDKKEGSTYNSFYRFNAGPNSTKDKWSNYIVDKANLGLSLIQIIDEVHKPILSSRN